MKPVRGSLLALAALLCALAFVPAAFADSQARIVRLSFTDGTVQIDRDTGQLEKAIVNMPIVQGTKLVTQDGARAEVEFEDGSTVRLGPATQVAFNELGLRDDGGKVSALEVMKGTAYFDITPRNKDEFRVAFAADEVTLDRAARFRVSLTDEKVTLAVFKGELKVKGPEEATVKKNQTLDIERPNGQTEVAKGIAEEPLDEWVKSREEYRGRYASAQYGAPYSGYYGLSDLNYYGNYYYQPGWGWMWRPYGVGYGWDPFYDGAWCWYPSYGYTWVSSYPWGWMPYRYGRWAYVPGWGWGWVPGGFGGGWQTIPVVVNGPPAYRPPQPPTQPPIVPVTPRAPRPTPLPTVIVRGHQPRLADDGDRDIRLPQRVGGEPGTQIVTTPQTRQQTPVPGTSMPRAGQPNAPGPRADRPSAPVMRPDRPGGPSPRVDRPSGPSGPSPRMDRPSGPSGPTGPSPRMGPSSEPRMSPPPSMPRSSGPSGPSGPSHSSGGGRPPK